MVSAIGWPPSVRFSKESREWARALSPFVGQTLTSFTVQPNAADLRDLTELVDAGRLTPVVERTYPFTELPEALAYLEGGHARGKVVIAPVP